MSRRSSKFFGPEPASVSSSRAWTTEVLDGWFDGAGVSTEFLDAVRLVVSELVGNAVRHAQTPIRATLLIDDHRLRLEVEDTSPSSVQRPPVDARSLNGRGLVLVERLSDQWGVDGSEQGKTVWAAWAMPDGLDRYGWPAD